ncbi:flippase-like domain-containing protein [Candidatus Saccharibacteria bacterium]|nr:flippase-like domain-containing protein [Candidatus Saccharibacteria bacterium]
MSKFKIIVNVATILIIAFFIFTSWEWILEALVQMKDLVWWLVILQVPAKLMSLGAVAHLYYSYFQNTGTLGKLKLKEMYKIAMELNFINGVFPNAGASGFSYLSLRLRPFGINVAASTLAQSMRYVLTFLSFLIFLGLGLFILAIDGRANDLVMLIGGSVFFLAIFGTIVFIFLISSRKRIKEFTAWLPKAINKIVQTIHYRSDKELIDMVKVERVLGEIHLGYMDLKRNFGALRQPFIYALGVNFFEIATVYVVYLAFGEFVNPGSVILSYAVANFAGLVTILPGGIGLYDALMVRVATITGVKGDLALGATLVYRVFNLFTLIPVGMVFYYFAVNRGKVKFDVKKDAKPKDVLSDLQSLKAEKKPNRRFRGKAKTAQRIKRDKS